MLSCPARAGVVCPDSAACCRLAGFHRRPRSRTSRYPSDTTDAQWALIDPLLPDPASLAGQGGRPEEHCRRDIVDAIFYLVDNGNKWRALPADFPPWSTVYKYLASWERHGITENVLDSLRDRVRLAEGRTAAPSAGVVDSQSVKAAETVGKPSRGYDAGKKINGRKRHIVVDTLGLLLVVLVTGAGTQDRDAARPLLARLATHYRRVRLVWADGGYAGKLVVWARSHTRPRRPDRQTLRRHHRLRSPAQTLGRRTNFGLDHRPPPLRPRLRTPTGTSRDHDPLEHDPHHQPPTRPHTGLGTGSKNLGCLPRVVRQ